MPGTARAARVKRSASVPYLSIISSGSMMLPSDLLILRRLRSRTRPLMKTWRKGIWPRNLRPIMIIRATQKKMMSKPVDIRSVG